MKRDLRAVTLSRRRRAGLLELRRRNPARVLLVVDLAGAPDLELQPVRQRVHRAHADAVQTARDLVALAAELAAGVQHRHHDFCRRTLLDRVVVDRNAATVILDGHRVVEVDGDVDASAMTGEMFVDRVVDDFVDEVMQTAAVISVTDVHPDAANALEPFNTDRTSIAV